MERRVVITGMGVYSCIGRNLDEVRDSLYNGRSGIGIDPERKQLGFFSSLTGIVERPNMKEILDRKRRRGLAEQGEYAYMSTLEAFRNARIDDQFLSENEVGILFGNDSSAKPVITAVDTIREKKSTVLVGAESVFQSMNSTVTMNLSVIFHLKGINFTVSGACASSSHAIGIGYLLIKQGLQNCILCGGAQEQKTDQESSSSQLDTPNFIETAFVGDGFTIVIKSRAAVASCFVISYHFSCLHSNERRLWKIIYQSCWTWETPLPK